MISVSVIRSNWHSLGKGIRKLGFESSDHSFPSEQDVMRTFSYRASKFEQIYIFSEFGLVSFFSLFFFSPENIYLSKLAIAPLFSFSREPSTSSRINREGFFSVSYKVILSDLVIASILFNSNCAVLSSEAFITIGL